MTDQNIKCANCDGQGWVSLQRNFEPIEETIERGYFKSKVKFKTERTDAILRGEL